MYYTRINHAIRFVVLLTIAGLALPISVTNAAENTNGPDLPGPCSSRRVLGKGCTPDPTAIAWILLSKYETSGAGIFASTTDIQRVNTTGGIAPVVAGTTINQVMEVPYTAEYYFYRAEK